jgi:L-threonylcarbamoyladenylate synthase
MLNIQIVKAAAAIRNGGIVAFPTETVYGLGADAFNAEAVARVFTIKKRPRFDPLIVHIEAWSQIDQLAVCVPDEAKRLAEAFWPGPLTIIVQKSSAVPDLVTSGLAGIGIRMPRHETAQALIRAAGTPIAAPSANSFGCISPTNADHVREDLGHAVDFILDGGPCKVGIESTIISFMDTIPLLLRPGAIPIEDIKKVIKNIDIASKNDSPQASPGRSKKHYAPRTPMVHFDRIDYFPSGKKIGLIAFDSIDPEQPTAVVEILSPSGDLAEAACNLFAALKRLDNAGLDLIVAMPFPDQGLGRAINDRIDRAAQGTCIEWKN